MDRIPAPVLPFGDGGTEGGPALQVALVRVAAQGAVLGVAHGTFAHAEDAASLLSTQAPEHPELENLLVAFGKPGEGRSHGTLLLGADDPLALIEPLGGHRGRSPQGPDPPVGTPLHVERDMAEDPEEPAFGVAGGMGMRSGRAGARVIVSDTASRASSAGSRRRAKLTIAGYIAV